MEDVGGLIGKGFDLWKNNLNLCIPFVLSLFISILALLPLIGALALILGSKVDLQTLESITSEELLSIVESSLLAIAVAVILTALLMALIGSFFTAGAIGMASQALETGKSTTDVMWSSGRRHLWNMFLANIITGVIVIAGAAFLLPGVLLLIPSFDPTPQTVGLLVAGIMLLILYALAVSLFLAVAPYALVVDNLKAVEAIKSSIGFFRFNKFDVFVLWLIVVAISMGLQMIGSSTSAGDSASFQPLSVVTGMVSLLILAPLSTLWWTRLYMSRTGKLRDDGVKDTW